MSLLLKGARLVDPAVGLDTKGDLLIQEGRIVEVALSTGTDTNITTSADVEVIDMTGRVIVPGFIDLHVHLREPGYEYKETIASGTRAAVHGGFVGVCAMANTNPVADDGAAIEFVHARAAETAYCTVYPYGAVTKGLAGERLAEMGDMRTAGAVAFSDDGRGVQSSKMLRTALEYVKMLDVPLVLHCEDESLVGSACVNEGRISTRLGMKGSPALGEALAVTTALELAKLVGARVHICHVSTRLSVEAIARAKAAGVAVTAEVTPHHLLLTEEALDETYNTALKMNPPLRTEEDRVALIDALRDGTIDALASDHAPHAPHEKDCEFDLAAFGTIGLETTVPALLNDLVTPGMLDLARFVDALAHRPRAILGLEPVTFTPGTPADLTVLDLAHEVTVTPEYLQGISKNSAFLGRTFTGCATDVIQNGRFTMRNGEICGRN
ncbi:MAG: dihydroorotase [Coriobacteriia bacterium]|nr:dihydroorotase [Coriobacteriia bacterium]